jgi:hypothetical protein
MENPRPKQVLSERETRGVPSLDLGYFPEVRIAADREELLAAYRLVYQRYADRGLVQRSPDGILYSSEFASGDSRTFVALTPEGEVTATATIVSRPQQFEYGKQTVIPWKLADESSDRRYAGVTCLAAADCSSGPKPAAFFALTRFLFQYARVRGCDSLLISIHPRQLKFYGRICPIIPLGPAYRQAKLGNALAVACRIDLDDISLMRVAPSVLSWFETPIRASELNRPGISSEDNTFLEAFAEAKDYRVPVVRSVTLVT